MKSDKPLTKEARLKRVLDLLARVDDRPLMESERLVEDALKQLLECVDCVRSYRLLRAGKVSAAVKVIREDLAAMGGR